MAEEDYECPVCGGAGSIPADVISIATRRTKMRMSRYKLARLSGISNVTIRNIELGKTKPYITTIKHLTEALDHYESSIWQGA